MATENNRGPRRLPEQRVVLLGGRWSGKSSTGNTILGCEKFESGRVRTAQCETRRGEVAGRQLTVVDSPGWRGYHCLEKTPERDKQEIKRSASECLPGPHVFLLIVPVDCAFTEEHRRTLEKHLRLLGDRVWRHVIVLFTNRDWLGDKTIEQHIEAEGKALRLLVEKCGNRYHVFDNKNRGDVTQVRDLLEKIDEMVAANNGSHYEIEEKVLQAMEEKWKQVMESAQKRSENLLQQRKILSATRQRLPEVRIILLGSRHAGKTSSVKTILGTEGTERRKALSVKTQGEVDGRRVTVINTPGWWGSISVKRSPELLKQEIACSLLLCPPGPSVFLLVVEADASFTEKQRAAVEEHLELLGRQIWKHTIVLFTGGDCLGVKTIEQHIEGEGKALQWLVEKCGNRYHVFDNECGADGDQVRELLEKIEEMAGGNNGDHYEVDEKVLRVIEEKRRTMEERAEQRRIRVRNRRARAKEASCQLPELRLVLLGGRNAGKTASGSTILGREAFVTCASIECKDAQSDVDGRRICVVDTPGCRRHLVQSTEDEWSHTVLGFLTLCSPGPHAFLIVVPVDLSFTEHDRKVLEEHWEVLGEGAWKHAMVLFTYGDTLGDIIIEQHIEREGRALRELVEKCGCRYHVLDNKNQGDGTQVKELLEKIEEMVLENRMQHFSPDMTQISQTLEAKVKERDTKKMKEMFEEEWGRREEELTKKFKRSLRELVEDIERGKLPAKLTSSAPVTPNLRGETDDDKRTRKLKPFVMRNQFEKEWRRRENKIKETIERTLTDLAQETHGLSMLRTRGRSIEFILPSMSGSNAPSCHSTEDSYMSRSTERLKNVAAWLSATERQWTEQDSGMGSIYDPAPPRMSSRSFSVQKRSGIVYGRSTSQ